MSDASPPPAAAPAVSRLPPHTIRLYQLDRAKPLVPGHNPLPLDVLSLPHEVTIPRREKAAHALVLAHCKRPAVDLNHTAGGHLVAFVLAPESPKG